MTTTTPKTETANTITKTITTKRFEALEKILTDAGVIDHAEWFCRGGAQFIARGQRVTINPKAFNGATWIVDIETTPLVSPSMN